MRSGVSSISLKVKRCTGCFVPLFVTHYRSLFKTKFTNESSFQAATKPRSMN